MTTTNQTNGVLKKYFYSGIGFAAHSKEVMQRSVNEFVKYGKVSETEGKQIMDNAIQRLEAGYNDAIHKLGMLSTREISKLKTRIEKMEHQLAIKNPGAKASSKVMTAKANKRTRQRRAASAKSAVL